MIETATGLVLRAYALSETSLIVHWLTEDQGRLATVAKGARRPKSPFRGKLDLFYLAEFSFSRSRRSELHTLREVTLRDAHSALRRDLNSLQQAAYCAALVELATETETPLPHVYRLLRSFLSSLAAAGAQVSALFAFELKLLNELGLNPDMSDAGLSDGATAAVSMLSNADWAQIAHLRLSQAQTNELGRFLDRFIAYHLGRVPRGRETALGGVERQESTRTSAESFSPHRNPAD